MMHIDFTWSSNLETSSKEDAMSELKTRIRTQCKMLQSKLTLHAMVRSSSAIGARLHNAILAPFFGEGSHLVSTKTFF